MSLREWTWVGVAVLCAAGWLARPLSYEALASALFGAAIGAVISGAISWYFYQQASDDLKDIHARTASMLQTMSGGGRVTVARDEQGNTVVTHHITIADELDSTDSVQVSTGSEEDRDPQTGA
jgi:hypothetical protein